MKSIKNNYEIFVSYFEKFALVSFGIALWHDNLDKFAYNLLIVAWLIDKGLLKLWSNRKEPVIVGIIVFVLIMALGRLWALVIYMYFFQLYLHLGLECKVSIG